LTKTEKEREPVKNPLLDPDGRELGDDFLANSGERNPRLVERLRGEEEAERQVEAARLHRQSHPLIGVLAIQGDYAAHAEALAESGAAPVEVRKPDQLAGLDGLILPGGESTTILRFLEKLNFFEALQEFGATHPLFGTCAGAILLARQVLNPPQRSLGLLDATVERNAYGRQIDSSILTAETALPGGPLEMVFIRAPRLVETGPQVEILARRDGSPVLVRQGGILAATFHPELSTDRRVHQMFVDTVKTTQKQ
jgi:5'-phosphate synthase pdxT subunit